MVSTLIGSPDFQFPVPHFATSSPASLYLLNSSSLSSLLQGHFLTNALLEPLVSMVIIPDGLLFLFHSIFSSLFISSVIIGNPFL